MHFSEEDLPKTLGFFVADTGDSTHGFSNAIRDEEEYERVKRHYGRIPQVEHLYIGHYVLDHVEKVK